MRTCTSVGAIRLPVETRSCALSKPAPCAQAVGTALAFILHFENRTDLGCNCAQNGFVNTGHERESVRPHAYLCAKAYPTGAQTNHFIFLSSRACASGGCWARCSSARAKTAHTHLGVIVRRSPGATRCCIRRMHDSALGPGEKTLGWEINPTVFAVGEFRSKLASGNHFLRSVM